MCYRISRYTADTASRRSLVMCLGSVEAIVLHTSCDGCRFRRSDGLCADRFSRVDRQVTDNSPRLCYDVPRTLHESMVLYALEHESECRARGQA